jgi:hypothetical protein
VAGDQCESPPDRLQLFFERLFTRDPSGRSWLPALLSASPHAGSRLRGLLENPGGLSIPLAVRTVSGRLACFEYPVAPPRELLAWFIDHPGELVWPLDAQLTPETVRLRRALLCDDPPGSQLRAQERARELLATRSLSSSAWWRFEDGAKPDCVLITDRLVVTIEGSPTDPLSPATDWYPDRSRLLRSIEAAKTLAEDKPWATLLLSESEPADGTEERLERALPAGAPHLNPPDREDVRAAYLGSLTWETACEATGVPFESLSRPADPLRRRLGAESAGRLAERGGVAG